MRHRYRRSLTPWSATPWATSGSGIRAGMFEWSAAIVGESTEAICENIFYVGPALN
jgi:hypothetical protein